MAATCPNGHQSATDDYCDVCGAPIGGAPSAPAAGPPPAAPAASPPPSTSAAGPTGPSSGPPVDCPNCGTENTVDALFCEDCGYDFTTGQKPAPDVPLTLEGQAPVVETGWEVEVTPDRDWYAVKATADTDPFPAGQAPHTVALRGHVAMIGRESASRGIHPDIDAGTDAAVSRRHAQLVHSGDTWQIVDLDSTNGTTIAKAGQAPDADPLPSGQPRPLAEGDSVMVGAWTRITLRRTSSTPSELATEADPASATPAP
jgi:FHA domain-containing protein/zinc ribbon protein